MRLNPGRLWGSLLIALAGAMPLRAVAQTTQPLVQVAAVPTSPPASNSSTAPDATRPNWADLVERLSSQLTGHDIKALRATLGPDVRIKRFVADGSMSPERLLASTIKAKLLGSHAYAGVPTTLASDLAVDFRSGGDVVPEQTQKEMTPREGASEKRANETAASWVNQVLQPKKDQPIGVIVFWPTEVLLPGESNVRRAIFVLIKGQFVNNGYVVQQVTFGDPLESPG